MSIQSAFLQRQALLRTLGTKILNTKYPNEFEYYLCAFELTDSNYETIEYFLFPIMPSQMRERQPQMNNVKRTMGGITNISNPNLAPPSISLSGNFGGKAFKIIQGTSYKDLTTNFIDKIKSAGLALYGKLEEFDKTTKTGYGCIKILERILNSAKQVGADNKPLNLVFYNLALGNSYFVKVDDVEFSMDMGSNMIWNYNINMTALGKIENYVDTNVELKSNKQLITDQFNRNRTQALYNGFSRMLTLNNVVNADAIAVQGVTNLGQSTKNLVKSKVDIIKSR